jgi:hypothetical protein
MLPLITYLHLSFEVLAFSSYNADPRQCQGDHTITAFGKKIDVENPQRWIAVSRDMLWCEERQKLFKDTTLFRGPFKRGDTLWIVSANPKACGPWEVWDVMGSRWRRKIDFLCHPQRMVGNGACIAFQ